MASSNNTSAVLDVVAENKEISQIFKESIENDKSNISNSVPTINPLVQSQSFENFSTLQDVENLSELNVDENSDLCVRIDSPQKHLETLETYITFRITTKAARIEFPDNEYVVRRRYNDFVWLRHKLVECHPFCIIPPLPGKHSLIGQLDRYSKDFIISRMKSLNIFMKRVIQHPILSCNDHLKAFLTAKNSDFTVIRRQRSNSEGRIKPLPCLNPLSTNVKKRHIEFDVSKSYLTLLADKLAAIEKLSSRIYKEQSDLVNELNNFHPIFTSWASNEPELAYILRSIGKALERTTAAQSALVQNQASIMIDPVKDFLAYIEVVQDTLKKRESYQYAYENILEELNKKHNERDKLVTLSQNPSQPSGGFSLWRQSSCDEKLEKLGTYIPQLLKKVERYHDNLECANESLRSDLQRWQMEKHESLKQILINYVNKQVEYYQIGLNAWESASGDINLKKSSIPINDFCINE